MRALLFILAVPVVAQFSGLATTSDGGQLYFSSTLQLTGAANENSYAKIFRYDASGIRLVAQTDKVATAGGILLADTNAYNLYSAYVSGDGSVFGYTGIADCTGVCYVQGLYQTTLQYPGELWPTTLPYTCSVSQSARYAACIVSGRGPYITNGVFSLFDSTQTPIYTPSCPLYAYPGSVSSNGLTVCGSMLSSASGTTTLPDGYAGLLSDDGSTTVASLGNSLMIYKIATGVKSSIPFPNAQAVSAVAVSSNGGVILFNLVSEGTQQLAAVHSDGTGLVQLANDPSGVTTAVLSGDGSVAYAVMGSGSLLKLSTVTGASAQVAAAAQIQQLQGAAVAGSLTSITGAGLADAVASASTVPLPVSLGGVQVTVNGTPAPLLSVSPFAVTFQMPWETAPGSATIAVTRPASQFLPPTLAVTVLPAQPYALIDEVFSGNFSSVNSESNPANPGDIVNFYVSGLGAVTVPVADGAASPSKPLAVVTNPVMVTYGTTPLNVLYAGLAPGTVGVYQLTVQLLASVPQTNPLLPQGPLADITLAIGSYFLPVVWMNTNQ